MPKTRRDFTGAQKAAILREHWVEKVPISDVCEKRGLHPTLFYQWQKKLFEEGASVLQRSRRPLSAPQAGDAIGRISKPSAWSRMTPGVAGG